MLVDGARDEFLARASLTRDEDWYILGSDTTDRLVHFAHRRAPSHHTFTLQVVNRRLCNDSGLAHQACNFQCLTNHSVQLLQFDWLQQVVVSPKPHRLDG